MEHGRVTCEKVKGRPRWPLTVVDEVLEDLLAARLHGVMQQRAAGGVLQQDVRRLLVQLHQLEHKGQGWSSGGRKPTGTRPRLTLFRSSALMQLINSASEKPKTTKMGFK